MGMSQRTQRNVLLFLIAFFVGFLIIDDEDLQFLTGYDDEHGLATEFREEDHGLEDFAEDTTPLDEAYDEETTTESVTEAFEDETTTGAEDEETTLVYEEEEEENVVVEEEEENVVVEEEEENVVEEEEKEEKKKTLSKSDPSEDQGFMRGIKRYLTPEGAEERILTDPRVPGPKAFEIRKRQVLLPKRK